MYYVRCTLYDVLCTMYFVRCTLYDVIFRCTMFDVLCTMYLVRCTLYDVLCTMFFVRCTIFDVLCTIFYVRCTMHDALCTMYYKLCNLYYVLTVLPIYRGLNEAKSADYPCSLCLRFSLLVEAYSYTNTVSLKLHVNPASVVTLYYPKEQPLKLCYSVRAFSISLHFMRTERDVLVHFHRRIVGITCKT